MIESGSGCVGRGGGRPTVRARIVSPAGVHIVSAFILSPPDDHFTASPHCRVIVSASRCVGCGGGYPVIDAPTRRTSYDRKYVVRAAHCGHPRWHLGFSFSQPPC